MLPEKPWQRFAVAKSGTVDDGFGCLYLTTVSHVCHLEPGYRIIADQELRSGLIFDESKLNTERILVSWLSPNDWEGAGGFAMEALSSTSTGRVWRRA